MPEEVKATVFSERSKQDAAFPTPTGLYQLKYLPFGLDGVHVTF